MKISFNWLNTLIDLKDITPETVEKLLTSSGLEVENLEEIETVKGGLKGLVIGLVVDKQQHPNADRLSVTKVDIGTESLLSIVCGAPNVAVGQKVVVAPVGTTVYPINAEPFKINKAKIRGELSEGMICAEDEIGLGHSHDGIMVLPENAIVGTVAKEYFKIQNDWLIEIGLTANRGDAASHLGVARELACLLGRKVKLPVTALSVPNHILPIAIQIENQSACQRYSSLVIQGVKVKESPDWLKNALLSIGLHPINNIVDATNFVLHELGQPIHAFDYKKIVGQKVIVKNAKQDSVFVTLDGVERKMNGNELMIWNEEAPMAIAGVFGGKDSGISDSTDVVLVESAYFEPGNIRKTAKFHGLSTDASFRYERGCDPEITVLALKRVASVIMEVADGSVASEIIDLYPNKIEPFKIELRKKEIIRICGLEIKDNVVEHILAGLEIKTLAKDKDKWDLEVPVYRSDVQREIDVIEEIIRIYGLDKIPMTGKVAIALTTGNKFTSTILKRKTAAFLVANGFSEMMSNSLTKQKYYNDSDNLVVLENPLSQDLGVLRKSMLYSGLEAVAWNRNRKVENIKLFEFGKTYTKSDSGFEELNTLFIIVSGNLSEETWYSKPHKMDYYFLQSLVSGMLEQLGVDAGQAKSKTFLKIYTPDAKLVKEMEVAGEVWIAELNWQPLVKLASKSKFEVKDLPKFPVVRRDLSLVLDKGITFERIKDLIDNQKNSKIKEVNVFDVYEGKPLENSQKAYALSLKLYDDTKTLEDKTIDGIMKNLMQVFEKELNATIRK